MGGDIGGWFLSVIGIQFTISGWSWSHKIEVDEGWGFWYPFIFLWNSIWKVKAPCCVSFFVWTVVWDRILTGDNLESRGFDFIDWCIMCHCCGETMGHFLLHCEKTHHLCSFVFRTFGISWVLSRLVTDFLFSWWNWLGSILLTFGI